MCFIHLFCGLHTVRCPFRFCSRVLRGNEAFIRHVTSYGMSLPSRYRRNTITRYGNRIAILSELNAPRTLDACDGATGHATPMAERELMERFDMSRPMDQIDNSSTKPLQTEHHGQMSSRRSQRDVRLENCESQARRDLPTSLTASQHGSVTLLRLSRPAKRNALDDATIAGIESFFSDRPVPIFRPLSTSARRPAFAVRGPGTALSTGLRMAVCRSSLSFTAASSVAVWSSPPLHISGSLNVARTTRCQRARAAYSLAAVVPCAYRA